VPIKEKTAREKALEFAKNNIPKPRMRKVSNERSEQPMQSQDE